MPPTPKAELSKQKQKEANQKKLLFLLVPVLIVLAVIQGPKLMKAVNGGDAETVAADVSGSGDTAAAETSAATTEPASTTVLESSASTDPAAEAPLAVPTGTVELVDSDLPPAADEGQLVVFDRFVGKDPFKQLVTIPEVPVDTGSSGGAGAEPADGGTDGGGDSSDAEEVPDTAILVVNGTVESVKVGGSFPSEDPTFRLAAIDSDSKLIRFGLVTGSFSTGTSTLELEVGHKLTLVSQPDGVRYELELKKLVADSSE